MQISSVYTWTDDTAKECIIRYELPNVGPLFVCLLMCTNLLMLEVFSLSLRRASHPVNRFTLPNYLFFFFTLLLLQIIFVLYYQFSIDGIILSMVTEFR